MSNRDPELYAASIYTCLRSLLFLIISIRGNLTRNATPFMSTRILRPWCRSIFPRRDTPIPDAITNLEPQPLQFPFRVHVSGRPHGLLVSGTDTGGAGVCGVAPYTWSKGEIVSYKGVP